MTATVGEVLVTVSPELNQEALDRITDRVADAVRLGVRRGLQAAVRDLERFGDDMPPTVDAAGNVYG